MGWRARIAAAKAALTASGKTGRPVDPRVEQIAATSFDDLMGDGLDEFGMTPLQRKQAIIRFAIRDWDDKRVVPNMQLWASADDLSDFILERLESDSFGEDESAEGD